MRLKSLYLHDFRVYEEAFFEFSPTFNVIQGPNAQGKTSLLEAIYFLTTGKSFRGAQTSQLIRHGAEQFYLEARFVKRDVDQVLRATCGVSERKFMYNSTQLRGNVHLLGLLQGVIASPDDVSLVKGAPVLRRQYLDFQIAQIDPLYVYHITRYARALRQRNCLLRAKQVLTIEGWEHEMALSAVYITQQRAQAVRDLQASLSGIYGRLAGAEEPFSIEYKSSAGYRANETYFLELYKKCRKRETDLGATLYGPHKDDLLITVEGRDVRSFASEGQQRTCVAGLRFAEWERLSAMGDAMPLMLIDDAGMGFDDRRCSLLADYLRSQSQVFLTTTSTVWTERLSSSSISKIDLRTKNERNTEK